MKKLLFLLIVLLVSGAIQAQGGKVKTDTRSFLAFHAGPSFPVGDFYSTDIINHGDITLANREAGFAKVGVNANLTYSYKVLENLGLAASVFYNNNNLNQGAIEREFGLTEAGLNVLEIDHWKWYGLTVGPMLMHNISPKMTVDLRVMGGIANANSPKIAIQGEEWAKEDWAVAPVFQGGLDLRFGFGNNMFIFTNVDYLYMKPKFNIESFDINDAGELVTVTEPIKQKMSVVNLTGGFGIRF